MISETATPPATEVLPERLLETPLEDLAATVAGLSAETRRKLQCYIERMMTNAMATVHAKTVMTRKLLRWKQHWGDRKEHDEYDRSPTSL